MTEQTNPESSQAPQPAQQQPVQQQPVQQQPVEQPLGTSGLAIGGMVLGILAVLASFIPIINNGAFIIGIIGLVLSIAGLMKVNRGKSKGRGIAIAGIVLCIVSLAVTLMVQAACSAALDSVGTSHSASSATTSAASTSSAASEPASDSAGTAAPAQPSEPTLGSTFTFDGLDITLGDTFATTTISNQFSDHNGQTVIALPVSITNNNSDTHSLNMFALEIYGSQGTELDTVYTYFDDDVRAMGDMRPGATQAGNLYFLYDGNGEYFLDFGFINTDVEVKIPVAI